MKSCKQNKNAKSRRDTAVQGTNDSSIVSKWSMSHVGYFKDDYLQFFIGKKARRCPLINRGYYIRAKAMERVFDAFLSQRTSKKQVISLGAGFDSSYFRLKSKGELKDTVYIEVDFPDVARRKLALIRQSIDLRDLLSPEISTAIEDASSEVPKNIVYRSHDYVLLGVDLTRLDVLTSCLTQVGCDVTYPSLFLSEVALTYMTNTMADSVLTWASRFENAIFASYEQIHPDDAFGRVMMTHFDKLGSPLRCINKYPRMASQVSRYIAQGWSDCQAVDMNYFFCHYIAKEEQQRINTLEPFDEYETWHLKCSHYTLICAYNGTGEEIMRTIFPDTSHELKFDSPMRDSCDYVMNSKDDAKVHILTGNDLGAFCRTCKTNETSMTNQCLHPAQSSSELILECLPTSHSGNDSSVLNLKRFGHSVCLTNSDSVIVTGGFGELNNKHVRMDNISYFKLPLEATLAHSTENQSSHSLFETDIKGGEIDLNKTLQITQNIHCESETGSTQVDLMYHSSSYLSNGNIVILCGRRSPLKPNTRIFRLELDKQAVLETNASQNEFKQCHGKVDESISQTEGQWKVTTYPVENPILHRWRHSACCMNINGIEHILVYGGISPTESAHADCWTLDTNTWRWIKVDLSSDVIGPLHSQSASVWQNKCVFSGGLDMEQKPTHHIHCLAVTSTDSVKFHGSVTRIETNQPIIARYSHTSAVCGDILYLIGGVSFHIPQPGVTAVNLTSGNVIEYRILISPSTPVMLYGHDSVCKDRHVYIIGGGGNCFSFGTHLNQGLFRLTLPHQSDTSKSMD